MIEDLALSHAEAQVLRYLARAARAGTEPGADLRKALWHARAAARDVRAHSIPRHLLQPDRLDEFDALLDLVLSLAPEPARVAWAVGRGRGEEAVRLLEELVKKS